jgi:hypothetical protein
MRNIKNKRGWIKMVEAFVAIVLITTVLLLVLNQTKFQEKTLTERIYEEEIEILRIIQLDETLREEIMNIDYSSLPVLWPDFNSNDLTNVKTKIDDKTPSGLECVAHLCSLESQCLLGEETSDQIYVQQALISSDLDDFSMRKIKLFCWGE